jgi:hypothetical protein
VTVQSCSLPQIVGKFSQPDPSRLFSVCGLNRFLTGDAIANPGNGLEARLCI